VGFRRITHVVVAVTTDLRAGAQRSPHSTARFSKNVPLSVAWHCPMTLAELPQRPRPRYRGRMIDRPGVSPNGFNMISYISSICDLGLFRRFY